MGLFVIILVGKIGIVRYLLRNKLPFWGLELIIFDKANDDFSRFWARNSRPWRIEMRQLETIFWNIFDDELLLKLH